jgi:mannosyltransferase
MSVPDAQISEYRVAEPRAHPRAEAVEWLSRHRPVSEPRDLWILGGITALAAIIRFATLGHQSYDHDEAVTALRVIHPSLTATMHSVVATERSPPLYYLLAWLWSKLFGAGEVGLRSLSAVLGTLTVPAAYLAGRRLGSARAGLIAAALVALNPYLFWYSQEARSYALYVLFSAWALYLFARALRDRTPRSLFLWALVSVLALCSHYFAAFLVIPEGLMLACTVRPRRPAIAAVAMTAVAGLALAPLAYVQEGGGRGNLFTSHPVGFRAEQALLDFVAGIEPPPLAGNPAVDWVQIFAAVAGALLLIAAIVLVARRGRMLERLAATRVGVVAAASFGLPLLLALAGFGFVEPRKVLIGSVVPLLILAGIGFGARRAGRLGLAAAGATSMLFVGVLAAIYVSGRMQRPNWRAAAQAIGPAHQSRVLVVANNGQVPLAYYLHASDFRPEQRRAPIRAAIIVTLGRSYAISPPGRGFRLVELRHVAGSFWLRRYRAPRPLRIDSLDVRPGRLLHESSLALYNIVPHRAAAPVRRPLPNRQGTDGVRGGRRPQGFPPRA